MKNFGKNPRSAEILFRKSNKCLGTKIDLFPKNLSSVYISGNMWKKLIKSSKMPKNLLESNTHSWKIKSARKVLTNVFKDVKTQTVLKVSETFLHALQTVFEKRKVSKKHYNCPKNPCSVLKNLKTYWTFPKKCLKKWKYAQRPITLFKKSKSFQ